MRYLALIIIGFGFRGLTQDINYSNVFSTTQLYNPALTALNNDFESSVIYRTQGRASNAVYNSFGASFASTLLPKRRKEQGNLTIGVNFYREQFNDKFSMTSILATTAYHFHIGKQTQFSAGINYGIFNVGLNPDGGQWASQHDGVRYNPNVPSGEVFSSGQITKLDVGSGLQLSQLSKKISVPLFQFGYAAFHVNQPKLSTFSGVVNRLQIRSVFNTSIAFPLGIKGSYLQSTLSYQKQGKFQTTIVGMLAAIKLKEEAKSTSSYSNVNEWYGGIGWAIRSKDAFILNVFVQKSSFKLAFAYDFTISTLNQTNNSRGAAELILLFNVLSFQRNARF